MGGRIVFDFFIVFFVNEAFFPKSANATKIYHFLAWKPAKTSVNAYQSHYFVG